EAAWLQLQFEHRQDKPHVIDNKNPRVARDGPSVLLHRFRQPLVFGTFHEIPQHGLDVVLFGPRVPANLIIWAEANAVASKSILIGVPLMSASASATTKYNLP